MILKSTVPQIIFQAAGLLPSSDLRGDCRLPKKKIKKI